ncbi:Kelch domain-containing protein 10 [Caenorhabditis elegans]|uniref:Kelch domain-containing protein 10 n=1 Tax=Caenorhabditis elegans TaxID=6239 RepID=H8ESI2_CAEEL|nr:Kelch domain-containing protein 10 [Caenorhabditis elegans]CCG28241.1 Kelch domain-containing protein 10 [Caenorhabditis elegans]|eukprot:NP_001255722.1 Uncharacterized protein CELE_Y67H2A.2 [Caenorhabditis elegans]
MNVSGSLATFLQSSGERMAELNSANQKLTELDKIQWERRDMTGTAVILETRKPNLNSVMEAMSMLMFHRMTIGNCQIGSEIDKIKDIFQIVHQPEQEPARRRPRVQIRQRPQVNIEAAAPIGNIQRRLQLIFDQLFAGDEGAVGDEEEEEEYSGDDDSGEETDSEDDDDDRGRFGAVEQQLQIARNNEEMNEE